MSDQDVGPVPPGGSLRIVAVAVTGVIAISAYAGVVGLVGGGLSFGDAINARLPFASLVLAGLALLVIVAVPMTIAAVMVARRAPRCADGVFAAGLLLVAWIAIQLAYIKTYSWFHPTFLAAAVIVLGLGWLLLRSEAPLAQIRRPVHGRALDRA